jgi:sulfur-oxidizing protein SoxZ
MADPTPTAPRARSLIHGHDKLRRGQPGEIRVTLAHPMENGLRHDGYGNVVPRSIVTRFECRLDGKPVFAADLYTAIAANPYLAFWLKADGPGTLSFEWTGDWGFSHRETRAISPA